MQVKRVDPASKGERSGFYYYKQVDGRAPGTTRESRVIVSSTVKNASSTTCNTSSWV